MTEENDRGKQETMMHLGAWLGRHQAFGMIASAVCALVGPIFVPFFIVPKLDFLFWSWFKAFIQYSFIPVIAFAFLMVFERFVFRFLTTLPPGITEDQYMIYGLQAFVIAAV